MAEWTSLPYGVDLGDTRVRIAFAERNRARSVRLRAVVARDLPLEPELLPALLEEMLEEIGARERRCILAVGAPIATLRAVRFPKMTWAERLRAARFEAQRFAQWQFEDESPVVRTHPLDRGSGAYAVGVIRAATLDARVGAIRSAGLRAVAVDADALALVRLFPSADAILDVGAERASLHLASQPLPATLTNAVGGAAITRGIAGELGLDFAAAERRKRILGCAGAGVPARLDLITALTALVEEGRARSTVTRIALTGNGARLPELARELEEATGSFVEMPVPEFLNSGGYPDDVVRVAAPDWSLAAALATWSVAA
jgi:Tfp pilus assembly PilM family ATPase